MSRKPSIFETETCSRCGGSGHYSYNQISGTTCFKCNGRGECLSTRGRAAYEWLKARHVKPAGQVVVGDRCYFPGYGTFTVSFSGIEQHSIDHPSRGCTNGVWVTHAPAWTLRGQTMGWVGPSEHLVTVLPPKDVLRAHQAEALAYQATLTVKGKPRKVTKT